MIYTQYLDRLAGAANSRLLRLKESLGVFAVPANMLRMVVDLEPKGSSRHTISSEDRMWKISAQQDDNIKHAIEHIYADQDE